MVGKDPDAGKDWGQEEKGAVEDEKLLETVKDRKARCAAVHGLPRVSCDLVTEQQ